MTAKEIEAMLLATDYAGNLVAEDVLRKYEDKQEATQILVSLLKSEHTYVQTFAAYLIGNIATKEVVPYLLETYQSANGNLRANIIWAFVDLMAFENADFIVRALDDEDFWVRYTAVRAVGAMGAFGVVGITGNEIIVEKLEARLSESNLLVQTELIETLAAVGGGKAFRLITEIVDSGTPELKEVAVKALGYFQDSASITTLINLLKDHDLARIAADVLAQYNELGLQALLAALRSENGNVRWYAAYALGAMGDEKAIPNLVLVSQTDKGKSYAGAKVKEAAARAIERINKKSNLRTIETEQ